MRYVNIIIGTWCPFLSLFFKLKKMISLCLLIHIKIKTTKDISSITSFHPTCIYKKTPNLSISSSTYMNIKGHQYPLKYIHVPMHTYAQPIRLVHMNSPIISSGFFLSIMMSPLRSFRTLYKNKSIQSIRNKIQKFLNILLKSKFSEWIVYTENYFHFR